MSTKKEGESPLFHQFYTNLNSYKELHRHFHRKLQSILLLLHTSTEPSVGHPIVSSPTHHVIDVVRSAVEKLPESTLTHRGTRLGVKNVENAASTLRPLLPLGLAEDGEEPLQILDLSLFGKADRSDGLRHLLVLTHLALGNAHSGLHHVRVERRTVRNSNRVVNLLAERESQRVIANDPNRRKPNVNALAVNVRIGEQEELLHSILTEERESLVLDARERPNHTTVAKRAGSMHFHVASLDELREETERLRVLDRIPVIADNIENLRVAIPNQSALTDGYLLAVDRRVGGDLRDRPIKISFLEHLLRRKIRKNLLAQTVPRHLARISHRSDAVNHFNFVCHDISPI
jgi:hypothetical protein